MNKKCLFLFLIFSFFFFSCSHKNNLFFNDTQIDTLKNSVIQKNNELTWSKEIESDKLIKPFVFDDSLISKEVQRSSLMVISQNSLEDKIFPELEGFANLDTSLINQELYKRINEFCECICYKNIFTNLSSFFNSKFSFNCILFLEDFKLSYEKNINTFPYNENSTEDKYNLFSSFLIGKPELTKDFFEIPIRFYCQNDYVDLTLNVKNLIPYEIYDINILGWGNENK